MRARSQVTSLPTWMRGAIGLTVYQNKVSCSQMAAIGIDFPRIDSNTHSDGSVNTGEVDALIAHYVAGGYPADRQMWTISQVHSLTNRAVMAKYLSSQGVKLIDAFNETDIGTFNSVEGNVAWTPDYYAREVRKIRNAIADDCLLVGPGGTQYYWHDICYQYCGGLFDIGTAHDYQGTPNSIATRCAAQTAKYGIPFGVTESGKDGSSYTTASSYYLAFKSAVEAANVFGVYFTSIETGTGYGLWANTLTNGVYQTTNTEYTAVQGAL